MDAAQTLPTGVVTFLLTDIEGSTRRWEREPEAMREALHRHDALVRECVQRLHGHVVKSKGEGDSVFVVFRHVRDAVNAAIVLQCALLAERWSTSTPLRVRMAIHTGEVELRNGDYYGTTVNRCARLRALANGGQVLLSGATAELAKEQLPSGASLKDLGTHQLKDLRVPERIWQLTHPQMTEGAAKPAQPTTAAPVARRLVAYLLTDHRNCSTDGREWGPNTSNEASGDSEDDDDGYIPCYTTPSVAALLNAQYERLKTPRLWEATIDREPSPGEAIVACKSVTTTRQVSLPSVTGRHHAKFAVLCARSAYEGGRYEREFGHWAETWLEGHDSSGVHARAMADKLEAEADRGYGVSNPVEMMASHAARSAMHAARLSWLVGRERDGRNTQAIESATESVGIALEMAHLDLAALADQAIPSVDLPPGAPDRTAGPALSRGILRALPT
jgi:class 3 adenylate cyclase